MRTRQRRTAHQLAERDCEAREEGGVKRHRKKADQWSAYKGELTASFHELFHERYANDNNQQHHTNDASVVPAGAITYLVVSFGQIAAIAVEGAVRITLVA